MVHNVIALENVLAVGRIKNMTFDPLGAAIGQIYMDGCFVRSMEYDRTLAHVLEMLKTRLPKSLKVCVLLDKKYRRKVPVPVDYVGFDVPDKYVFG